MNFFRLHKTIRHNLEHLSLKSGKDVTLKIAAPSNTKNSGGISIFGKGFDNYYHRVRVEYS